MTNQEMRQLAHNQMAAAQNMDQSWRINQLAAMQNQTMPQYARSAGDFAAMQNSLSVFFQAPHVCETSGCCTPSSREVHSGTYATTVKTKEEYWGESLDSTVSYTAPAKDKEWEQVKARLLATNHVPRPWVSPLFVNKMRWNFDTPTRPWAAFFFTSLAVAIFLVCL